MKQELMGISCQSECAFSVRGRDTTELVSVAKKHMKDVHDRDVSNEDLLKKATKV